VAGQTTPHRPIGAASSPRAYPFRTPRVPREARACPGKAAEARRPPGPAWTRFARTHRTRDLAPITNPS